MIRPPEEERGDVHSSSLLIDVMPFSMLSPTAVASMTQAEKSRPFLLKSDVNLFNHLVRKRMLWVVVSGLQFC